MILEQNFSLEHIEEVKLVYNPVKQWLLDNGYLVEEQKAGS